MDNQEKEIKEIEKVSIAVEEAKKKKTLNKVSRFKKQTRFSTKH